MSFSTGNLGPGTIFFPLKTCFFGDQPITGLILMGKSKPSYLPHAHLNNTTSQEVALEGLQNRLSHISNGLYVLTVFLSL